jgi:hypothetical protein
MWRASYSKKFMAPLLQLKMSDALLQKNQRQMLKSVLLKLQELERERQAAPPKCDLFS